GLLLEVSGQRELLRRQGIRRAVNARHPQPDRGHVGTTGDAHGRRDTACDRLLRSRGEPAAAAAHTLRRPPGGLRRRRRPALPPRGHAHGSEGGGSERRAPVLHHGGYDGEPVPAPDLRARALPRARSHQLAAEQAAGDLFPPEALTSSRNEVEGWLLYSTPDTRPSLGV